LTMVSATCGEETASSA